MLPQDFGNDEMTKGWRLTTQPTVTTNRNLALGIPRGSSAGASVRGPAAMS